MATGFPLAHAGMRIGVLGGSFDPAHCGHVDISRFAKHRFGLDRIWWMVSPGNPLKSRGPAPLQDRIAAARRLLHDPDIVVTDVEARLGTRMTADTITELQRRYPGVRFVWLMGSDNLVQFDQWDRWRQIAASVPIGVLSRPGSRVAARHAPAAQIMRRWRLPQFRAGELAICDPPAWVLVNLPMSPQSSTAIRAARIDLNPDGGAE
jgi:nicotinate-nucleotide adenylyltransferase